MTSILHKHLGLDVNLRETVASIGVLAQQKGKADAAAACLAFAASFKPDAVYTVNLRVDVLLVNLVEHWRNANRPDMVAQVEELIALVKSGDPQRVIVGSVDYAANSVGELDDQLEALHRKGVEIIGAR